MLPAFAVPAGHFRLREYLDPQRPRPVGQRAHVDQRLDAETGPNPDTAECRHRRFGGRIEILPRRAGAASCGPEIRQRAAETRQEMRSAEVRGGGPTVPFVGRSEELRSMFDAWARVRRRRSGTVVLRGGAGVGKTRLAEEFIRRIEENATWVHVRPGVEGSDRPLAVVRSLVAELRTRPGSRGTSPDFESLLEAVEDPERALRDEWLDPDTVAAAIADLLGAVAFEAPLVVLLDDAHRADDASLEVLDRVVARAIDAPVMLIVCTRESNGEPADEKERDVASRVVRAAGDRPATLVELRPFSEQATRRLLNSFLVVPDSGDESVIHQVQELTQGNALFVVFFLFLGVFPLGGRLAGATLTGFTFGVWLGLGRGRGEEHREHGRQDAEHHESHGHRAQARDIQNRCQVSRHQMTSSSRQSLLCRVSRRRVRLCRFRRTRYASGDVATAFTPADRPGASPPKGFRGDSY